MTSEAGISESAGGATSASGADGRGLIAPDVRVGGRRILLTPHNCFACGQLNVHGLQLDLHAADDRCWTELVLPERFEGWEGIAHGGIIATILDEVMGWAIIGTDMWGVTARMTLEFKRPVAVGGRYRAEGWVVRARRRLVESAAHLLDADTGEVLATAEALYVGVSEERKRELKARYAYALVREGDEAQGVDSAGLPEPVDEAPTGRVSGARAGEPPLGEARS